MLSSSVGSTGSTSKADGSIQSSLESTGGIDQEKQSVLGAVETIGTSIPISILVGDEEKNPEMLAFLRSLSEKSLKYVDGKTTPYSEGCKKSYGFDITRSASEENVSVSPLTRNNSLPANLGFLPTKFVWPEFKNKDILSSVTVPEPTSAQSVIPPTELENSQVPSKTSGSGFVFKKLPSKAVEYAPNAQITFGFQPKKD